MKLPTLVAAAAAAGLAIAPGSAAVAPDVAATLTQYLKITGNDLAEIDRGRIVKRSLESSAAGEVAVVGAVRVNAPVDTFVDYYRNIEAFKSGPDVIQIGRFSVPPQLSDVDRLTIGRDDVDLRSCRVGSCDIRLSKDVIQRLQREIDWSARDADAQAAAFFKRVLVENVRAYLTGGPGRIVEYDDEKRAVRPVDDFAALLKASPYVGSLVPALPGRLRDPASTAFPGAEEFLYWSKERSGPLPSFITVTHVVMATTGSGSHVIASRDVYSSRYLDASLSYTVASPVVGVPSSFYLVYANRSRAAGLKGAFASLRKSIVERRAKNALEEQLKAIRGRLERGGV